MGPAGKLLDRALADAGVDPALTYTTNVVKHFRFSGNRGHYPPERRPASTAKNCPMTA